ncbi:DUF6894 family protein [Bradyrhizobium commune]|uniref:DUF6894 domain-containing protein n=1 Tax=Bradyrhizobium commune TaxID=83627 RepID=A0A7S9DA41_9BRAD|nr:hypothetical protein [Bradyrhizobium commune]QPF93957.1 hypothetical protein IC761_12095 [Bradyrhizobium commune]
MANKTWPRSARHVSRSVFLTVLDEKFIVDTVGEPCATWEDMRAQAIRTAGECLRDLAAKYPADLEWQLIVTNEKHDTVLRLRFALTETPDR